jgi:hypothetical protein
MYDLHVHGLTWTRTRVTAARSIAYHWHSTVKPAPKLSDICRPSVATICVHACVHTRHSVTDC